LLIGIFYGAWKAFIDLPVKRAQEKTKRKQKFQPIFDRIVVAQSDWATCYLKETVTGGQPGEQSRQAEKHYVDLCHEVGLSREMFEYWQSSREVPPGLESGASAAHLFAQHAQVAGIQRELAENHLA
jgi:hypothetical protein